MGFGDFASSLGSVFGGAAGAALGYGSAKALQEDAQQFQTSFYKQRYQRTMADMRAAGLNPILAYKQGPGSTVGAGIASSGAGGAWSSGMGIGPSTKQAQAAQTQAHSAKKLRDEQITTELYKQAELWALTTRHLADAQISNARALHEQARIPESLAYRNYYNSKAGSAGVAARQAALDYGKAARTVTGGIGDIFRAFRFQGPWRPGAAPNSGRSIDRSQGGRRR